MERGGGGWGEHGGGGQRVVVVGRAEIDTRAPFRSVKEAVALFGEKVLAGELSAGRRLTTTVNENRAAAPRASNHHHTKPAAVPIATVVSVQQHQAPPAPAPPLTTTELAVAKQALEKEREEKQRMAGCIQTLQAELSHAMRELKRLKDEQADEAKVIDLQVDDVLKFVEDEKKQHAPQPQPQADDQYNNNNIWEAIRDMPSDKAPGPDGFTGLFYKVAWNIIKEDLVRAFNAFWTLDGRSLHLLNDALMILLRKKPDATEIRDFRPISLMHSFLNRPIAVYVNF